MEIETLRFRHDEGWGWVAPPIPAGENTVVFLFASPELGRSPGVLEEVLERYPGAHVVGCSTAGEIHGATVTDGTVTGAAVRFDRTRLRSAAARVPSADRSRAAGGELAGQLAGPALRGIFVLSEGTGVNGSELVAGLNEALPAGVVVTGGLAGDGTRFERTWVLKDRRPEAGWICAIGFYGEDVRIGHGSKGGWDIFGPERRVTRSVGNVLYELDGRPALGLYKEYLGELAAGLPATALLFPLALRVGEVSVVRTILNVDESEQSLTFAGDVPEGSLARLMRANFDRLITAAGDAAGLAVPPGGGTAPAGPTLCLAVSCVGRRLVLGERTAEELEAALEVLPPATVQTGFYSYGELSPLANGTCDLHNQTLTLTTLSEG